MGRNTYIKEQLFKIYDSCCYCGKKLSWSDSTVEHLKPRAFGGHSTLENCRLACFKCNNDKNHETQKQYPGKLMEAIAKLNKKIRIEENNSICPTLNEMDEIVKNWTIENVEKMKLIEKFENLNHIGLYNKKRKKMKREMSIIIKMTLFKEYDYCLLCGKKLNLVALDNIFFFKNNDTIDMVCGKCNYQLNNVHYKNELETINLLLPKEYEKMKIMV